MAHEVTISFGPTAHELREGIRELTEQRDAYVRDLAAMRQAISSLEARKAYYENVTGYDPRAIKKAIKEIENQIREHERLAKERERLVSERTQQIDVLETRLKERCHVCGGPLKPKQAAANRGAEPFRYWRQDEPNMLTCKRCLRRRGGGE